MRAALRILLLLGLGANSLAQGALQDLALPSLRGDGEHALSEYRGKVVLMSFFEPDCPWCYRQMKVLNRLQAQCGDHLQPLSVGVNGDVLRLRKEVRRAKVQYPALSATPSLMNVVGDVPATPWTLIFGPQGQLLGTLQGYIRLEKMQKLFADYCTPSARP